MIGLDTNVLLRGLVDREEWSNAERTQIEAAQALIADPRQEFFVNHVVLAETVWVLSNSLRQPKAAVAAILNGLLEAANVLIDEREAVAAAAREFELGKADFADYLIGHVNRMAGCEVTVSFDKDACRSELFRHLAT